MRRSVDPRSAGPRVASPDALRRAAGKVSARRAVLVAAARRIVQQRGPDALTIAAVAREADVSKAAVFYSFPTAEALHFELVLEVLRAETDALVTAIERAPDGLTALGRFVTARVAFHLADLDRFRLAFVLPARLRAPRGLLARELYPLAARTMGALERRLQEERRAGRLARGVHPRRLANVAFCTAQGILQLAEGLPRAGGALGLPAAALAKEAAQALVAGATARGA